MASLGKIQSIGKQDRAKGTITNRAFLWSLNYLKPYKKLLIGGLVFGLLYSVLYTAGITAVLPVLKLLVEQEGLHAWVYRSAAEYRLGAELSGYDPVLDPPVEGAIPGMADIRRFKEKSPLRDAGAKVGDVLALAGGISAPSSRHGTQTITPVEQPYDPVAFYQGVWTAPDQPLKLTAWRVGGKPSGPAPASGEQPPAAVLGSTDGGVCATQTAMTGPGERLAVSLRNRDTKWTMAIWAVDLLPRSATRSDRLRELGILLVLLLAINITGNLFRYLSEYWVAKAVFAGMVKLRGDMNAKALRLPMGYFTHSISDTTSRFVQDTQALSRSILLLFGKVAREPFKAIGAFAVLLWMDPKLVILGAAAGVPSYFLIRKAGRVIHKATERLLVGYGQMLKNLEATFVGLKVVKAYNAEEYEAGQFNEVDSSMLRQFNRLAKVEAMMPPLIESVTLVATAGGLLWLASTVLSGERSSSEFLAMGVIFAATFDPIRKISAVWNRVQGGGAAAERIKGMLDTADEATTSPGTVEINTLAREITFENVSFSYPGASAPALAGVNLTIPRGKTVAIVGSNGSGKTTLVSLLPRYYLPSGGRIRWDGIDIAEVSLRSLRREIGLISQETVVFPLTIRANIAYGLEGVTDADIREAARKAHALEFIDDSKSCPNGLDTLSGEQGVGLSGGQRQRIALARLILRDSPVLIMDEATSAADAESESKINDALVEFAKNKTVLIIAHRFRTVQTADLIAVMEQGRLIDQGTHDELYQRCERYKALCDFQFAR